MVMGAEYHRTYYLNNKEAFLESARTYRRELKWKNPAKHLHSLARARAKQINIEFNLKPSDIIIPDICPNRIKADLTAAEIIKLADYITNHKKEREIN